MWLQLQQTLSRSTEEFLTRVARLFPEIVALIAALLISILLAWILAAVVQRILDSIHFDARAIQWGFPPLGAESLLGRPSRLVSRTMAFAVIIVGLLIGISAFDAESISLLLITVFGYVPNVIGAILVLVIGTVVARFLARSVLIGAVNMNFQHGRLLSVGVKWLVIVLAVAMALEHLKIGPGIVEIAFGILFGGIVLTLALAVGLNSRELVTKSFERDAKKQSPETLEEPFHHL
jgi:hypothetical protein